MNGNEKGPVQGASSALDRSTDESSTLASAAIELARNGWEVFPLRRRGKIPYAGSRGHLDASADPELTAERWEKFPGSNIGARVPESVVVIDLDPRNGAAEHLDVLEPIEPTLFAYSGRGDGGMHLYYRRPVFEKSGELVPLCSSGLPDGIDVKTSTGYVVMPPSIHPATDQPYRWGHHDNDPWVVAPLPPHLIGLLTPMQTMHGMFPERTSKRPRRAARRPTGGKGLLRFVEGLEEGNRNNGLYWATRTAADEGLLDESFETQLFLAAASIGLSEPEITRTLESAMKRVTP